MSEIFFSDLGKFSSGWFRLKNDSSLSIQNSFDNLITFYLAAT